MKYLSIFLCLFFFSCGESSSKQSKNKDFIDNKLEIGMKREFIISELGEPDKSEVFMYPGGSVEQLLYKPNYIVFIGKGSKVTKAQGSKSFDEKQEEKSFNRLLKGIAKLRADGKSDADIKKYYSESFFSVIYDSKMVNEALKAK